MKRSLWISTLLVAFLMIGGCRQNKDANGTTTEQTEPGRGAKGEPREAPRHGVPDQESLDSLKQEKLKEKE